MKKLLALVLGLAAFFPGCGGSNSVPLPVIVTISPTSATIALGSTLQFTAAVANTSNTAVTWEVNGTVGGSSSTGTISTTGLYTAPPAPPPGSAPPVPAPVTITAVSQADTSASASATVTLTEPSAVSVSPSSVTVLAGATQQFTATVTGLGNTAVTWQVNGTTGGNSTVGAISTSGFYTAPSNPPSGQKVKVTAVSQANSSVSASATVTVAPSLATLNGQYAFLYVGQNSLGLLIEAGSFRADGKGKVLNGVEDINSGAGIFTDVSFTGAYTVGADGRGSLLITPASSTGLNSETFDLGVTSNQHALLVRFDTFATGSGTLDLQDSSAFAASALKGNFVVNLDGIDSSGAPLSSIALLTLNGAASVPTGLQDANDDGSVSTGSSISGSYSVGSNGRGSMTLSGSLGTFDFVFYVLSGQKLRLVSIDAAPAWSGSAVLQQGSNFTNASLHGPIVFAVGGTDASGNVTDAGQFVSSAAGGVVNGIGDENDAGSVTAAFPFTGNYSITPNGHGSLQVVSSTLGTFNYSFYLCSDSQAALLGTDSAAVTSGQLTAQAQSQFSAADVSAPFAFTVDGTDLSILGPLDKLGQFTATGTGKATGTEDSNDTEVLNSKLALTATYTLASDGRGTLNVTAAGGPTRVLNFYLVSPDQMLLIGGDTDQVLLGVAQRQFP